MQFSRGHLNLGLYLLLQSKIAKAKVVQRPEGNIESLVEAEKDVLHSILEYPAATHEQKLEAARTMTDTLKELEGVTKARVKSGISSQCELDRVQVSRVDAEIQLEKLKMVK